MTGKIAVAERIDGMPSSKRIYVDDYIIQKAEDEIKKATETPLKIIALVVSDKAKLDKLKHMLDYAKRSHIGEDDAKKNYDAARDKYQVTIIDAVTKDDIDSDDLQSKIKNTIDKYQKEGIKQYEQKIDASLKKAKEAKALREEAIKIPKPPSEPPSLSKENTVALVKERAVAKSKAGPSESNVDEEVEEVEGGIKGVKGEEVEGGEGEVVEKGEEAQVVEKGEKEKGEEAQVVEKGEVVEKEGEDAPESEDALIELESKYEKAPQEVKKKEIVEGESLLVALAESDSKEEVKEEESLLVAIAEADSKEEVKEEESLLVALAEADSKEEVKEGEEKGEVKEGEEKGEVKEGEEKKGEVKEGEEKKGEEKKGDDEKVKEEVKEVKPNPLENQKIKDLKALIKPPTGIKIDICKELFNDMHLNDEKQSSFNDLCKDLFLIDLMYKQIDILKKKTFDLIKKHLLFYYPKFILLYHLSQ